MKREFILYIENEFNCNIKNFYLPFCKALRAMKSILKITQSVIIKVQYKTLSFNSNKRINYYITKNVCYFVC